jgi:regulator of protease activity HflC (stomatin/prohibitin superfamily)
MFWKLAIAIGLAVAVAMVPELSRFWPWVLVLGVIVAFVIEGVRIVPQQSAWVVERLGRFHGVLEPGLNLIIPFLDRVGYVHSLKEVPLDVPEQVCITKDNTQLGVDGILYYQVTDPRLASYGSSNYIAAISQLAQTTLRSEIGKMELDKTFESRDEINRQIVASLDEAGRNWGIKVLRYEIKSLTPPEAILRSMQQQITAEREKRALIAKSEGERQQEINVADGEKQAAVLRSEGEKQAAINKAQGEATAIRVIAEATAAGAGGGRCHRRQGRARGGESQGGAAVRRGLRQPREELQHLDPAFECGRRRRGRSHRDDGSRPHAPSANSRQGVLVQKLQSQFLLSFPCETDATLRFDVASLQPPRQLGCELQLTLVVDEQRLADAQLVGRFSPAERPGYEQRLACGVGQRAGTGPRRDDHCHRASSGRRIAAARIDDVSVALAAHDVVPAVIPGGSHRLAVGQLQRAKQIRPPGPCARILQADAPRRVAMASKRENVAADVDERVRYAAFSKDRGRAIERIAFRVAAEIEPDCGIGTAHRNAAHGQIGHPRMCTHDSGDFR